MPRKSRNLNIGEGWTIQYTTLKVRLYPTEEQAELFEKTFGCCRYIWNRMLADQQRFYIETDKFFIPTPAKYKREAPFLKEVDNQALIQEHNRLQQAFRVFFKNQGNFGYPQFKRKKDDRNSFTACSHDFPSGPTIYTTKGGIRMTKAGIVSAKFHRRPQAWWKLKRITVDKTKSGKYYGYILYECRVKETGQISPKPEKTVGLKFSVPHFYVADNGAMADPPRWLKKSQKKLTKIQRSLSRMQPGSRNYHEMARKFRLVHEHIANQRRDFIHNESRRITNAWDAVCMRSDSMEALSRNVPFGHVFNSGYGMFRECLRYKLARQGKQLILIDRYVPSTRTCSVCGFVREAVHYKENTWVCPKCGVTHRREVNAAKNIKEQGLKQYFRMQEQCESA